jgi:hypothetical protein
VSQIFILKIRKTTLFFKDFLTNVSQTEPLLNYQNIIKIIQNNTKTNKFKWLKQENLRCFEYALESNKCSIEMFIKSALTLFFKRQHCKLSWLDKDSDKDQSQFVELFN